MVLVQCCIYCCFVLDEAREINLENLLSYLRPCVPKWQTLGEHLHISETILDEVFTNSESDEDCMMEMLSHWLEYHNGPPTWEEVTFAVQKLGECTCTLIESLSE